MIILFIIGYGYLVGFNKNGYFIVKIKKVMRVEWFKMYLIVNCLYLSI